MIDNVKQILRQVVTSKDKTTPTQSGLEVNILQFLFEYLQKAPESQLILVRSSLLSLMKEGLQLNFPPALFLLLVILRSYVQNIPLQEDKKVRKELQVTEFSRYICIANTKVSCIKVSIIVACPKRSDSGKRRELGKANKNTWGDWGEGAICPSIFSAFFSLAVLRALFVAPFPSI